MEFPNWYESTDGPKVSKTIFNIAGTFLPIINFALMKYGINILPADADFWISIVVFLYFSVQAGIGYVRAKRSLQAKVAKLEVRVLNAESRVGQMSSGTASQSAR